MRTETQHVYLCGDYNINLFDIDKYEHSSHFVEHVFSYPLYPLSNRPNRIIQHSATITDDIFSNVLNDLLIGILYTGISDYFLIFVTENDQANEDSPKYILQGQV